MWLDRFLSRRDTMEAILKQMDELEAVMSVAIDRQARGGDEWNEGGYDPAFFYHWPIEADNLCKLIGNLPARDVSPRWRFHLFVMRKKLETELAIAELEGGFDRTKGQMFEIADKQLPGMVAQRIEGITENLKEVRTYLRNCSEHFARAYWLTNPVSQEHEEEG